MRVKLAWFQLSTDHKESLKMHVSFTRTATLAKIDGVDNNDRQSSNFIKEAYLILEKKKWAKIY